MALNKVMLIGRLGADPEKRIPTPDFIVTNFFIATSEKWTDKETGEKQEKTEWHRIVAFKKLGEICAEHLTKGKQVFIEGKLRTRDYEKDGQVHYITEIVADKMEMLGPKDKPYDNVSDTKNPDKDSKD